MSRTAHILVLVAGLAGTYGIAHSADYSDADLATMFKVNGLRVSAGSEVAIINDQITRVGEQIGEAEVIAIDSGLVHMRVARRTFAMRVGSALIRESEYATLPEIEPIELSPRLHLVGRETVIETPTSVETLITVAAVESELIGDAVVSETYGPVAPGETLSEIAESFATQPGDREYLMAALYEHNPQAFGESMDMLYAGVRLNMPTIAAAQQTAADQTAAAATAEVQPGDTLSGIAQRHLRDDITLNQLMLAIYEASPNSFGGNLNILYAFEIITIPPLSAWRVYSPEAAREAVSRHAAQWHAEALPVFIKHNNDEPERIAMHAPDRSD